MIEEINNLDYSLRNISLRNQPYIVENIRAFIEENLNLTTRRTKIKLAAFPDYYKDGHCYLNPFSREIREPFQAYVIGLDPLDVCYYINNLNVTSIMVKIANPYLPYACPKDNPSRGPADFQSKGIVFTRNNYCKFHRTNDSMKIIYSYIVDAFLPGEKTVDLIVEWCPSGLVATDLSLKITEMVKIAKTLHQQGYGVKLTVLPGYGFGSPHNDGIYWSSGALYYTKGLIASKLAEQIIAQIYVITSEEKYMSKTVPGAIVPGVFGGWIHTYKTGIIPFPHKVGRDPRSLLERLEKLENPSWILESFTQILSNLPLEAREIVYHIESLLLEHGYIAFRDIIGKFSLPVYGPKVFRGLVLLPYISLYGDKTFYNMESGKLFYPRGSPRREILMYYVTDIKEKLLEMEDDY